MKKITFILALFVFSLSIYAEEITIFTRDFLSQNRFEFSVSGINTKDAKQQFDKIIIKSGKFCFEVIGIYDTYIYFYSVNGVKEGPLRMYTVLAKDSKNEFSFLDQNISGYIAALVDSEYNNSILRIKRKESKLILVTNDIDEHLVIDYAPAFKYVPWVADQRSGDNLKGELMSSKTQVITGDHGKYTVRFYKMTPSYATSRVQNRQIDMKSLLNSEDPTIRKLAKELLHDKTVSLDDENRVKILRPLVVTIQKEGEEEFEVRNIHILDAFFNSIDSKLPIGKLKVLSLENDFMIAHHSNTISDDKLVDSLIELIRRYGYDVNLFLIPPKELIMQY